MPKPRPTCRTYDVDGQPVRARSRGPLTEHDLAALAEFREVLKAQAHLKSAIAEQKEATSG